MKKLEGLGVKVRDKEDCVCVWHCVLINTVELAWRENAIISEIEPR